MDKNITKKSYSRHFRSDEITDKEIEKIIEVLNKNTSLLYDKNPVTTSEVVRTAIHHYCAEVTNTEYQDTYVQLIRDQLLQVLDPMMNVILETVKSEIEKYCTENNHDLHVYGEEISAYLRILFTAMILKTDEAKLKEYLLENHPVDNIVREVTESKLKNKEGK